MSEEKYYVPEITDFFVGFEYLMPLLKQDENGELYQDDYVKHIWHEKDNMWEYFTASYDSSGQITITVPCVCRVKYLDREDIESCGFECYSPNRYAKIYTNGNILQFRQGHNTKISRLVMVFSESKYETIFRGTIKNKSELKKVLKMLGI